MKFKLRVSISKSARTRNEYVRTFLACFLSSEILCDVVLRYHFYFDPLSVFIYKVILFI